MKKQRVILLLDHLCSGGAQRQITLLAVLLTERGFDVSMVVYYDDPFFESELVEAGIKITKILKGKISRIFAIRSYIRQQNPDIVIAFLDTPSIIAELAGIPRRRFAIIVSERTGKTGKTSLKDKLRLRLHYLADAVVANAGHLKIFVATNCPRLRNRVHVIHNCVQIKKFESVAAKRRAPDVFDIVTVGRYRPVKNGLMLCNAMASLRDSRDAPNIRLTWYGDNFFVDGKPTSISDSYLELKQKIEDEGLNSQFVLKTHLKNVKSVYESADAVCLASFYEGFSNVLGEAVACGKPVLASNVCDNPVLARENVNGYLFDPHSYQEIASAFKRIAELPVESLSEMGKNSRKIAAEVLSPEKFVQSYIELIENVTAKYM